jgi:cell wall-associated NlpC family hydrolase
MWRRLILIFTFGAFAGIFVIPLNPVNSKILNLALLSCIVGTWIGFTILTWRRKPLRVATLILPFLVAIPFILPSGEIDPDELRQDYVRRINELEGTKYFWGGESSRGIDCSGLPRRAFRDALLAYGIRHFNGRAVRGFIEQWWFDANAKVLAAGYRNYTSPIGTSGTIQKMSYEALLPGDLAVTTNGIHILAYAGDGRWIQADPGMGVVVTLDGRTDDNGWFLAPITTHRWQLLAQRKNNSEGGTEQSTTRTEWK